MKKVTELKFWAVVDRKTGKIVSTCADGTPRFEKTKSEAFYSPEYCYGKNSKKYRIERWKVIPKQENRKKPLKN